jgi:predicted dehydrogenase
MAADRGIAVFHKPPLARSTQEAGRLIQRFGEAGAPLVVARPWQFEPAFIPMLEMVGCAERIHVATADVATTDSPDGWRGDAARAGGGVLLHGAYEAVDMLIHVLGLPEVVYARCGAASVSGSARSYDTEDVAIMSLYFGHNRIGGVTARRGAAAEVWRATLATDDRTFEVRRDGLTVVPHTGGESEHFTVQTDNPADLAIGGFATSWLSGDGEFASTAADHLAVTAVIEAAYLSAKTGAPESPARLLD